MDSHTHESDRPPRGPDGLKAFGAPAMGAGGGEQALAGALRTVFGALRVVMVIALIGLVFSNTRLLRQNQRAVILRFGRIVGTEASRVRRPGLVFAWPRPIDEIIVVDAARVQALEVDDFMYRPGAREGGTEQLGETLDPAVDGYTVTGDANIIHTMWRVEYQIDDDDVVNYVLHVAEPEALLHRSLAAAVVHASLAFSVEEALWLDVNGFLQAVRKDLQERLDEAESGITITAAQTRVRQEPKQTTEAFLRSAEEGQKKSRLIQQAQRYKVQVLTGVAGDVAGALLGKIDELMEVQAAMDGLLEEQWLQPWTVRIARFLYETRMRVLRDGDIARLLALSGGEVAKVLSEARTYRVRVYEDARGMAENFSALNEKYQKNPEIFVRQTYQNAIQEVLAKAGYTFVIRPGEEIRLNIEPPRKSRPVEEQEGEVQRSREERMRIEGPGR